MKTSSIVGLLLLLPLAFAVSGNPTESPTPYEVVLVGEKVLFEKAETVSSEIIIRDLGVRKAISAPGTYFGLSVVWDGKEYKRKPMSRGPWNGPHELFSKGSMRLSVAMKDFPIPAEALTNGRHTIALKDALAESNTITVFIEKSSDEHAAMPEQTKPQSSIPNPSNTSARNQIQFESLDSKVPAFGDYDFALVSAIQTAWYRLLDEQGHAADYRGKVMVRFRLHYDGRITDLTIVENTAGSMPGAICGNALEKPSPFIRFPPDMRRLVGDTRKIQLTFFYHRVEDSFSGERSSQLK
jgi:hypothetical protein